MKIKGNLLIIFFILFFTLLVEAKKSGGKKKSVGKINLKGKKSGGGGGGGRLKKGGRGHLKKGKSRKKGGGGGGHKHVHHKGIQHNKPKTIKPMSPPLIHSTIPAAIYSPPFEGIETGQIPHDDQVALILDHLSKIGSTIDVFLRLTGTYPDGSKEQGHLIKNVYPPLRVLLEAQHSHEFSINK